MIGASWNKGILAAAVLLAIVCASPQPGSGPTELLPFHRRDEPGHIAKRGESSNGLGGKFKLQDTANFLWLSPSESNQNVMLSLDLFTKADEYVLDLARFRDELRDFSCSKPEHLTLHFKHNGSYAMALDAWSWVKGNNSRAFILVEDHPACKTSDDDRQRRPWLVTDLHKAANMSITLDASKKKWKEVLHTYEMKFGQGAGSPSLPSPKASPSSSSSFPLDARQLDWSDSFSIPLTHTFPHFMLNDTYKNIGIDLICEECGTKGSLEIAGHIAADIFNGLTKLELTVTGKAISANVELGLQFTAAETASWLQPYEKHFTIADIPLGDLGIVIPDLLTIGPNLQINGGITADKIQGAALFKSGVRASIPDPSTVGIDMLSKKKLSASGWTPQFEWDPLSVSESLNVTTEVYTELATAISLMILDEDGFNADVSLRIPDLYINAAGVYNSKGVCKGSKSPFGVTLDMSIGANLLINEYVEENGEEVQSLDIPLFSVPKAITIPEECQALDLGGIVSNPPSLQTSTTVAPHSSSSSLASRPSSSMSHSASSSSASHSPSGSPSSSGTYRPSAAEQAYLDHEAADAVSTDPDSAAKRSRFEDTAIPGRHSHRDALKPRVSKGDDPYYLDCDNLHPRGEPIYSWSYPGPSLALKGTRKSRKGKSANCPLVALNVGTTPPFSPTHWNVAIDPTPTMTTLPVPTDSWATEHIYERNWIPNFLDTLYTKHFQNNPVAGQDTKICRGAVAPFHEGAGKVVTDTTDATKAVNYLEGLMQSMGTLDNWWEIMVIFPQQQNGQKYSMFSGIDIDGDITADRTLGFDERVGRIGRIVAICDYMNQTEILTRLTKTVVKVQNILRVMDNDLAVEALTPAALQKQYAASHLDWFQTKFDGGFVNARARLAAHAGSVLTRHATDVAALGPTNDVVVALTGLRDGTSPYCKTPDYNVKAEVASPPP